MRENEFVEQLKLRFPVRDPVSTGIGDDGAVLTNVDGSASVIVTDMLLDGVHFALANCTPESVGRKAVVSQGAVEGESIDASSGS